MITNCERRKFRVRGKIAKRNVSARPRIVVSRSNKHIYAQLIGIEGKVINSFSTVNFSDNDKISGLKKAELVGAEFAKICLKNGVKEAVFDKGQYAYCGRVKALAEACRNSGMQF